MLHGKHVFCFTISSCLLPAMALKHYNEHPQSWYATRDSSSYALAPMLKRTSCTWGSTDVGVAHLISLPCPCFILGAAHPADCYSEVVLKEALRNTGAGSAGPEPGHAGKPSYSVRQGAGKPCCPCTAVAGSLAMPGQSLPPRGKIQGCLHAHLISPRSGKRALIYNIPVFKALCVSSFALIQLLPNSFSALISALVFSLH